MNVLLVYLIYVLHLWHILVWFIEFVRIVHFSIIVGRALVKMLGCSCWWALSRASIYLIGAIALILIIMTARKYIWLVITPIILKDFLLYFNFVIFWVLLIIWDKIVAFCIIVICVASCIRLANSHQIIILVLYYCGIETSSWSGVGLIIWAILLIILHLWITRIILSVIFKPLWLFLHF